MMTKIKNTVIKKGIILVLLFLSFSVISQSVDSKFSQKMWEAFWIKVPDTEGANYGVYLFRKKLEITQLNDSFPIYISADNKYQLYVNGNLISIGPAKGNITHWNFEQLNLAPFLKLGTNTIAAKVWNEGPYRQEAQISFSTGFILQGATPEAAIINTNTTWKCIQDSSYSPILISDYMPKPNMMLLPGYYVAGPGEKIDMSKKQEDWQNETFDDSNWKKVQIISPGIPRNTVGLDSGNSWRLVASNLPQMEFTLQRFKELRKVEGVNVSPLFPKKATSITIPSNTTATLLLDQTYLTNAYPTLTFSEGEKAYIVLTYAESLYKGKNLKGDRNSIEGKTIVGRKDSIFSNGKKMQSFTPLNYRTYRYVELKVKTKDKALVINDISGMAVGYPFQLYARLDTANPELNKMMDIGWRTAKLCAMDTYMDCPYWEQLQYIGDTRIQAMVSIYNSGDDRLIKNALNLIDNSRQPDGITLSRYPTNNTQIIAPFSLWYIGMLKDYMMYGDDREFIKDKLSGTRQIIEYFEGFQAEDGSVKNLPSWSFTDWAANWQRGIAPLGKDGSSALLDLQLLLALQNAGQIESELGMQGFVSKYQTKIKQLSEAIKQNYWDDSKQLFADNSDKMKFSQHANALAILAGLVKDDEATNLGKHIINNPDLAQASIYFKYYVHQALVKAGLGNDYLNWLGIWRKNMELGLTTWGEDSDVEATRSDCHAWGSSPNIEFFRIILGIDSDAVGFSKVKIEPHLGTIKKIGGEMPHPNGKIKVNYKISKKGMEAEISLPNNITGEFIWRGKSYALKSGESIFKI